MDDLQGIFLREGGKRNEVVLMPEARATPNIADWKVRAPLKPSTIIFQESHF